YRLDKLFAPRSVALVGASPRATSVGRAVLTNLRRAGFEGTIHLINPHYDEIDGVHAVSSIAALSRSPDLMVIAAPPPAVPGLVAEAGARGAAAAIIITSGLGHGPDSLAAAAEQAARASGVRLVGPNCLGVLVPRAGLNASFTVRTPVAGDLAVISQSGAITAGLVEWSVAHGLGFSAVVSLGDMIDVDFGDLLDFFALDGGTRAILLYIEAVSNARKFMSAARAAARIKPVVVIKSGRQALGAKAAQTHTGALAGSDAVYDAAFRRAGLLRVIDLDELFAAAETLGRVKPFPGKRLAVLTNGGGIGVLAVDRLADLGGTLAAISAPTMQRLDAVLPPIWSHSNPVDIAGDADAQRYTAAFEHLLEDPENDAVLVMNVPTALASAEDAAASVASVARAYRERIVRPKPIFAVWVGSSSDVTDMFERAGIPSYSTESDAVQGFMHLVRYRESLDALMATPPSLPRDYKPDVAVARAVVAQAVARLPTGARAWLDPVEITHLLSAYQLPVAPAVLARDPDEAVAAAAPLLRQGAVVAKILSPDIVHKSEVGGVRLNLTSAETVREAVTGILARAAELRPDARITGVTLHPMVVRPRARELIAGVADDPTFGPVIVFGAGGTAVEVVADKALALPPLDLVMARDLIARTRVARVLRAYRDVPAVDLDGLSFLLVKLAQLAADLPEVRELDLNPVLADENGLIAVDARVAVAAVESQRGPFGHPRLAIRPYPQEWERRTALKDGAPILVRPVRPEDEPLYAPFFAAVTAHDLRLRFFAPVKDFGHTFVARLTQIDYARAMAFVALDATSGQLLGVVRLHADANYESGEYAVLVRSDLKGRGLGWLLMGMIIEYARSEGLARIEGQVLNENTTMLEMCRELGFVVGTDMHDRDTSHVQLALR
ncbi:MAG: bifunctional acetate--CoA ligase family protein/GNAT family N-acetyltransferase, partial [Hyphomicrobiales bacterium]|nr:bifunctional acetate--CoA ligase family protein/GNAT family N-acetyltransferase [Hyphomicrobiales bacterium]